MRRMLPMVVVVGLALAWAVVGVPGPVDKDGGDG